MALLKNRAFYFVREVWQFRLLVCFIGKGSVLASIGIVATLDKSRATMPSKPADKSRRFCAWWEESHTLFWWQAPNPPVNLNPTQNKERNTWKT